MSGTLHAIFSASPTPFNINTVRLLCTAALLRFQASHHTITVQLWEATLATSLHTTQLADRQTETGMNDLPITVDRSAPIPRRSHVTCALMWRWRSRTIDAAIAEVVVRCTGCLWHSHWHKLLTMLATTDVPV